MSAVDEIINYKRSPDEDFYGLLNCNEHSTVSESLYNLVFPLIRRQLLSAVTGHFAFGGFVRWKRATDCSNCFNGIIATKISPSLLPGSLCPRVA